MTTTLENERSQDKWFEDTLNLGAKNKITSSGS